MLPIVDGDGWIDEIPRRKLRKKFTPPPLSLSLFRTIANPFQADDGATLRTRKFITNRLLNRKQFVSPSILALLMLLGRRRPPPFQGKSFQR